MSKKLTSLGLQVLSIAGLSLVLATACGGDDSDPSGSVVGGDDDTPATPPPAPVPAPDGALGTPNEYCSQTAPPNTNITTFLADTYVAATSGVSDDTWGDSMSLTGGAFSYIGDQATIDRVQTDAGLRVTSPLGDNPDTAEVEVGGYSGIGLWFGPCTYAAHYSGIAFTIQGSLGSEETGTAELQVQMQTAKNYPISADKGACMFESADSQWTDCTNNFVITEGTSPDEPTEMVFTWDQFTGGLPVATLEPEELLGVQFQFNCDAYCPVDVVISNLHFVE
jgi:hypothetical protein